MDKLRFEEMIKKLKCRMKETTVSAENAVTVASKLLEISHAMGDIQRELDECKTVIMENFQRNESMATMINRLENGCDKLAMPVDDESIHFEENARPRMLKIEETRDALLKELRDDDESRKKKADQAQQLREIIRQITDIRDGIVGEKKTVEHNIASLTAQLEDTAERIKCEKTANAAFYSTMENKQNDLLRRSHESFARLNKLLASKDSE